jgi:hypothetical protein
MKDAKALGIRIKEAIEGFDIPRSRMRLQGDVDVELTDTVGTYSD